MNLKEIRQEGLKDILDTLENVFDRVGIDFYYIIGAIARDIWYQRESKISRTTRDIDFAVLISNEQQFEKVKTILTEEFGFRRVKGNEFALENGKMTIDILPFGAIEAKDGTVIVSGQGMHQIKVNGFEEVAKAGVAEVKHEKYTFNIATLPSIVLLKMISYDDRPEARAKDAGDIAQILKVYFDIESNLLFDEHYDILERIDEGSDILAARVIGRKLIPILAKNEVLRERVIRILTQHIETEKGNTFVDIMASSLQKPINYCKKLLDEILQGIQE